MSAAFGYIERELRALLRTVEGLALATPSVATGVPYEQLAGVVKRTREQRGESQRDVARVAGIDDGAVWRIEHGMNVTPKQLAGVAKWLGLPIVFPP